MAARSWKITSCRRLRDTATYTLDQRPVIQHNDQFGFETFGRTKRLALDPAAPGRLGSGDRVVAQWATALNMDQIPVSDQRAYHGARRRRGTHGGTQDQDVARVVLRHQGQNFRRGFLRPDIAHVQDHGRTRGVVAARLHAVVGDERIEKRRDGARTAKRARQVQSGPVPGVDRLEQPVTQDQEAGVGAIMAIKAIQQLSRVAQQHDAQFRQARAPA